MRDQNFSSPNGIANFGFTLRDLLAIGFRQKRVLVLCFVGILLGTVVAMVLVPPKYQAAAEILVKRERVDPVVSVEKMNPITVRSEMTEEELNSEVELMLNDDVLRQTVATCGLDRQKPVLPMWPFLISQDKATAKAVEALKGSLKVEPVKKTNLIRLTYSSTTPAMSARVLSVLTSAYIEKHVAVQRPEGQEEFFQQESDHYRKDLDQAETQLKKFAEEQGGVAPQLARDITLQKLNDFSASLEQIRADMSGTEKRINDLEKQASSTPGRLTTQVRESDDAAVLQQLKSSLLTLELKRTELLTKYQPGYRLVQEIDKQIADTRNSITTEESKPLKEQTTDQNPTYSWISTELAKAKSDYSALQARAAATQVIVAMYQAKAHELEQKGIVHQDLLRTAKANEDNYLLYLHKREEARMASALDQTRILNVAVAQQPIVPALPTTSPWLFGLVGLLLACTVSVAAMFTMEYLDSSFRTPSEVLSELNIPVLAAVPLGQYGKNGNGNGNGTHGNGHHDASSAIEDVNYRSQP